MLSCNYFRFLSRSGFSSCYHRRHVLFFSTLHSALAHSHFSHRREFPKTFHFTSTAQSVSQSRVVDEKWSAFHLPHRTFSKISDLMDCWVSICFWVLLNFWLSRVGKSCRSTAANWIINAWKVNRHESTRFCIFFCFPSFWWLTKFVFKHTTHKKKRVINTPQTLRHRVKNHKRNDAVRKTNCVILKRLAR